MDIAQEAWKWAWTAFGATITGFAMGWFRRQAAKIREERLRHLAQEIVADVEAWAKTYAGKPLKPQDKKAEAVARLIEIAPDTDQPLGSAVEKETTGKKYVTPMSSLAEQLIEWAVREMKKGAPSMLP